MHTPAANTTGDHPQPARPARRHTSRRALLGTGLATVLCLLAAGCGSSKTPTTSTSAGGNGTTTGAASTTQNKTQTIGKHANHVPRVEKVEITSPVVKPLGELPSQYTCAGKNISPPIQWHGIPKNTQELTLDIIKVEPENGKLIVAWALAAINPELQGIQAGQTPPGAVIGTNTEGKRSYSLCPAKGTNQKYVAVLIALPHTLNPKPGFDAANLRLQALHNAEYEGFLVFHAQG